MSPARHHIETILIVHMAGNERARALAREVEPWLVSRGKRCRTVLVSDLPGLAAPPDPSLEQYLDSTDLALVLGGDGTMLAVANRLCARGIVLTGINCGKVGFLAELDSEDWQAALENILVHGGRVVSRIRLAVEVLRSGRPVFTCRAANDAVVSRGALARLVNLRLSRGSETICELRADGVAVSTPSGSTAYCVSAGGPVIHPSLDVFCVTPICPFLSHVKPMVLPCSEPLFIQADTAEAYLTCDGQTVTALEPGDVVKAWRSPSDLKLLAAGAAGFFERIRNKGIFFTP